MKIKPFICLGIFLYIGCTSHNTLSSGGTDIAVRDASRRLEETLSGSTGTNRNETPAQATKGGVQPRWIIDPYAAYPKDRYIAAVGHAKDRTQAEKAALAALTAIFERSMSSDSTVATDYSEKVRKEKYQRAVQKEIVTVSDNISIRDLIVTAASMDTLIGAEIGNVWEDENGIVYVTAYMDRGKTISIYTDLIRINNLNIENLTVMTAEQKKSFDGYARYKLAALISGINGKYAVVVMQAGGSTASLNLVNADFYNLEALNILRNITVFVNVEGDYNNRIEYAFSKILNSEGLRTQKNNSPYTLKAALNLSEINFPNSNNKFCHYTISANLTENATGSVFLQFNHNDRVGHLTYEGAAARAVTVVERIINEQYSAMLRECLAELLPRE